MKQDVQLNRVKGKGTKCREAGKHSAKNKNLKQINFAVSQKKKALISDLFFKNKQKINTYQISCYFGIIKVETARIIPANVSIPICSPFSILATLFATAFLVNSTHLQHKKRTVIRI